MRSSPAARATGAAVGAALLQLIMIVAFSWPAARTEPRDVPIVVTGPQAAVVADALDRRRPGAFDVRVRPDEAAARAAIADREAYGALVTAPSGPKVLTASAASPLVAQQLGAMAAELRPGGAPASAPVQDVVAVDADDPRGAGFGALALPLVMSGLAAAVLLTFALPSLAWRAAGTAIFAVLGGLDVAWIAQGWLSLLPGPYVMLAGVMSLTLFAVTGTVVGLAAAIGRAGIGLGGLTLLLLGNPLSAATSAPELLPQPWGTIGQYLPPGASATLLRSAAYFDGAGGAGPLTVLAAWVFGALVLMALGGLRRRSGGEFVPDREPVPA
ncbi:hypothetical protein AB0C21_01070 [Spirillospora sp. NPDC049024]